MGKKGTTAAEAGKQPGLVYPSCAERSCEVDVTVVDVQHGPEEKSLTKGLFGILSASLQLASSHHKETGLGASSTLL